MLDICGVLPYNAHMTTKQSPWIKQLVQEADIGEKQANNIGYADGYRDGFDAINPFLGVDETLAVAWEYGFNEAINELSEDRSR
jgi:hypothetical protein